MLKGVVANIQSVDDLKEFLIKNEGKIELERKGESLNLTLYSKLRAEELKNQSYLYKINIKVEEEKLYNKSYGDERICECGHSYEKHFDSYCNYWAVGCKYCECDDFVEKK